MIILGVLLYSSLVLRNATPVALCSHCTFLDMLTQPGGRARPGKLYQNFTRRTPIWFVWSHEQPVSCVGGKFSQRAAGRKAYEDWPGPAARPRAQATAPLISKTVLWWMDVVLQSGPPSPLLGAPCKSSRGKGSTLISNVSGHAQSPPQVSFSKPHLAFRFLTRPSEHTAASV